MLDEKTTTAINKYCDWRLFNKGKKNNINKSTVKKIVELLIEGKGPKLVAVTLGIDVKPVTTVKRNLRLTHNIEFPPITEKIYVRNKKTFKKNDKLTKQKNKEAEEFLNKNTKINLKGKQLVESIDLDLIEKILEGTDNINQNKRIELIEKHLKVDLEVARQIYHRYKKERIWW